MPSKAKRPCKHFGCKQLVDSGYCALHSSVKKKAAESKRGNSTERGYGYKWQQASKAFLNAHPTCNCEDCVSSGYPLIANVVDHIIPHRLKVALDSGDQKLIERAQKLFWSRSNWQAMNEDCHNKKTAREDGGFGRG